MFVQLVHVDLRKVFMMNVFNQTVLEGMRERTVANVMQQDGKQRAQLFFFGDFAALYFQDRNGFAHQVESPECMMKTRVNSSGIDIVTQAELLYSAQALKVGMLNNIKN